MALVRDICTSALRRQRELAAGETMAAEDAALALDLLNAMVHGWAAEGVDCAHQAWVLDDTFRMFVPARAVTGATLAALAYQGTWNASTNAPALTSGTGTQGTLYKVATAGSTALDGITSWSIGDYLVFNLDVWLKGRSADRHQRAVTDLLALRIADYFGREPTRALVADARDGWIGLQAEFVRVDEASFDQALIMMPTRRYYGVLEG
jgi:hypothetical protein